MDARQSAYVQLELFNSANEASLGRVVRTVETDLHEFGNRTDIIVVDGSTVRDMSLLECDDPDVLYFNNYSIEDSL